MGFKSGSHVKIWKVEDKGRYSVVEMSSSKKNKQSGEYETDFSSKFVRFIGQAHEDIKNIGNISKIKLGDIEVTNSYNKETKQSFTNFLVFSFTTDSSTPNGSHAPNDYMSIPSDLDSEDTPFK